MTRKTFIVDVDDTPGVLNRVASLIRRRNFNIVSLTVGHTAEPGISRMTIVIDAVGAAAALVEANLYKLVNVRRVEDVSAAATVSRELALIRVSAGPLVRPAIMQLADVFRARVIDVAPESLLIEITGTEEKIDGLVEVLRPYGLIEMARTGRIAMTRGLQPAAAESSDSPSSELPCSV